MEARLRIAGLELHLRTPHGDLVSDLIGPWQGYASVAERADIVLELEVDCAFAGEQPAGQPFPGFAAEAVSPRRYHFARADARGTIDVHDLVAGRFVIAPMKFVVEAVMRLAVSLALPRVGGLLLHASAAAKESALVFSGESGAGKTTIAGLLREHLPHPLGDDLVALRPDGETGWRVHATPFAGELGAVPNRSAPLGGIYFLHQAPRHHAERLSVPEAVRRLLRNTMVHVEERQGAERVLAAASALASAVPCYLLDFSKDPEVVRVLCVT